MKPRVVIVLVAAIATFGSPALSASADEGSDAIEIAAPRVGALDLSPRVHDDWAVSAAPVVVSLDLSPRVHDDWAVPAADPDPLDLSPRVHDDWAVEKN